MSEQADIDLTVSLDRPPVGAAPGGDTSIPGSYHAHFGALVALVEDGIMVVDITGEVLLVNEYMTECLDQRELLGSSLFDFFGEEHHSQVRHWLADPKRETLALPPCSLTPVIGLSKRLLEDEQTEDSLPAWIVRAFDAKGRKTGRSMLQEESQSRRLSTLGALTAGIVHDFNNVLGVVSILVDRAEQQTKSVLTPQDIEIFRAAIGTATGLARRLLNYASGEPPSNGPTEVAGTLKGIAEMVNLVVPSMTHLHYDETSSKDVTVALDSSRLETILINLIVNACHATEPAGGEVTVSAMKQVLLPIDGKDGRDRMELADICVRDTGTGMSVEELRRATQLFQTARPRSGGTGLGLATVASIAEEAGGYIDIVSTKGAGTAVHCFLPLGGRPSEETN